MLHCWGKHFPPNTLSSEGAEPWVPGGTEVGVHMSFQVPPKGLLSWGQMEVTLPPPALVQPTLCLGGANRPQAQHPGAQVLRSEPGVALQAGGLPLVLIVGHQGCRTSD